MEACRNGQRARGDWRTLHSPTRLTVRDLGAKWKTEPEAWTNCSFFAR